MDIGVAEIVDKGKERPQTLSRNGEIVQVHLRSKCGARAEARLVLQPELWMKLVSRA